MSLLIVRYATAGQENWGVLQSPAPRSGADIISVQPLEVVAATVGDLVAKLEAGDFSAQTGELVSIRADQLLSPVTEASRLICQGLNYGAHASESGHAKRSSNLLFVKASSSLSGPYENIVKPRETELLDYEVEVGLILRRDISQAVQITADNVGDYIAAVVLCNDVSARDIMFGAGFLQWFQGKSYRTFCPTGPVLYYLNAEDVADTLNSLEISLSLNGQQRQSAVTRDWIFKPAETLTQISEVMNLSRGDMILTGTPGGVLAQGTPAIISILSSNLTDDVQRRDEFRSEFKKTIRFMEVGDELTLTLRDARQGLELGGQHCIVASK